MSTSRIKTLVLYARSGGVTSYHNDWQDAFLASADLAVTSLDVRDRRNLRRLSRDVADYELVVILHSATADTLFVDPYRALLASRRGKLIVFVGNELNFPQHGSGMRHRIDFLQSVSPEFIATQLPIETSRVLYEDVDSATIVAAPHALNPRRFRPTTPQHARPIDIGVRSFAYFPFLGDNDRNSIMEYFARAEFDPPLVADVETDARKRLTAEEWPRFLNKCKGTISTEAGTSYIEKDDATVLEVAAYIKSKRSGAEGYSVGLYESRFKRLIPRSLKNVVLSTLRLLRLERLSPYNVYYSVDFNEVYERFFRDYEEPLSGKCISSRHFDAIGTKTCQVMFPGPFNGILEAGEHYIALERDFSNIDEVMERFRDDSFRCGLVDRTYDYAMANHTYERRLKDILHAVSAEQPRRVL